MKSPYILPPRFDVGSTKGDLTIDKYIGHFSRDHQQSEHQYEVKCKCGVREFIKQTRLINRDYCLECAKIKRKSRTRRSKVSNGNAMIHWPVPESVLKTVRHER